MLAGLSKTLEPCGLGLVLLSGYVTICLNPLVIVFGG